MNDPTVIAAAVVTVIVSLAGATVTVLTALTAMKKDLLLKAAEVDVAAREKLQANTITTERIESKVDGAATASKEEIKSLRSEMQLLRDFIAKQENVATALAATAAQQLQVVSSEPQSLPQAAHNGDALKQIEKNTGETAENTADMKQKIIDRLKETSS